MYSPNNKYGMYLYGFQIIAYMHLYNVYLPNTYFQKKFSEDEKKIIKYRKAYKIIKNLPSDFNKRINLTLLVIFPI